MTENSTKPRGSLALLGDYESDEKEDSPVSSKPAQLESDEKTEIEFMKTSSSDAGLEPTVDPGPCLDLSPSTTDDKKSDDEFKMELKNERNSSYRPVLSEESSSDDDEDDKKAPSPKQDEYRHSQSPKKAPEEEATQAVTESVGRVKSLSPSNSVDSVHDEKEKSPQLEDKPISPKVDQLMEEQGTSASPDVDKARSRQSSKSPEQLDINPKSHDSSKSLTGGSQSRSDSSPARKSPTPDAQDKADDNMIWSSASIMMNSPQRLQNEEASISSPVDSPVDSPIEMESAKAASNSSPVDSPVGSPMGSESAKESSVPIEEPATQVPEDLNDRKSPSSPDVEQQDESKDDEAGVNEKDDIEPMDTSEIADVEPKKEDSMSETADNMSEKADNVSEKADEMSEKAETMSEDDEPGTSSEGSRSDSRRATPDSKPWQTPRQQPIEGIVQPRTDPPVGKPTRHTNCLDFVLFTVIKDAIKHKHSWPFQFPVDAVKLEIPEYHNVITRPMDLQTVEKRIRSNYYWSAQDAIQDITQVFNNCYKFNPPDFDVYKMAKTLETRINVLLKDLPRSEKEQTFPESQRKAMFLSNSTNGKPKTPAKRGRKSTRGRKKVPLPRSASSFKESMDSIDDQDDTSSRVDSIHFDEDHDTFTEKDEDSQAPPEEIEEPKSVSTQPPAKKRKVENGENGVVTKAATPVPPPVAAAPAPAPVPRKNPNMLIDWKNLPPRWNGKPAEWQKFCSKLIQEMHSLKNKGFAQVFYLPVDPIKLKIFDYLDIIKVPMDLQTIKKKLDHKQYVDPEEFVDDMNLMVDNCCKYNPKGSAVHQNALDLKALFDERWKLFPRPGVSKIVSDSYINQSLIVNTDFIEDERINSYLSAVKAEEKKCAEKLEQLRSMSEGLYTIATQRREAKLAGNIAPALAANQLNQLDKLGINIANAPVMVPELISPALSVRSSNRAPVPKIIDDIGPSPIKARKVSKPRMSTTSIAPATPASTRGRKPKSGRPKKSHYSPAGNSPLSAVQTAQPSPKGDASYVSIYGRTNGDKRELSEKIRNVPEEYVHPILRIIQLGQFKANKDVFTVTSLCDEEIDFNDVREELIIEILDYLESTERDLPRAMRLKEELEVKAKFYGFDVWDNRKGVIPRNKLNLAPIPNRLRSGSPSSSATRSANRSSDSESESEESGDSDSGARKRSTKKKQRQKKSVSSSRASTPAGPSSSGNPKNTTQPPGYTLSESSSSSESNGSSDSSDSDSEPG